MVSMQITLLKNGFPVCDHKNAYCQHELCWIIHNHSVCAHWMHTGVWEQTNSFAYKDQIEELFIAIVSFYIFPTCNLFNFLVDVNFKNCITLFVGTICPRCAESAVKSTNQSYWSLQQTHLLIYALICALGSTCMWHCPMLNTLLPACSYYSRLCIYLHKLVNSSVVCHFH